MELSELHATCQSLYNDLIAPHVPSSTGTGGLQQLASAQKIKLPGHVGHISNMSYQPLPMLFQLVQRSGDASVMRPGVVPVAQLKSSMEKLNK